MPAPGFSMQATLANDRVFNVCDAVIEAWCELRDDLIGALEYDDLGTPYLADHKARIPAALQRVQEAERLARAEVETTGAMLD